MSLPFCDCYQSTKQFAFKPNCSNYVFCEHCITNRSKPVRRLCFFKKTSSRSSKFNCCLKDIAKKDSCYYLYTIADMKKDSSKPVVCKDCRSFSIGEKVFDNRHSIKWNLYKTGQLCTHVDEFGNECFIFSDDGQGCEGHRIIPRSQKRQDKKRKPSIRRTCNHCETIPNFNFAGRKAMFCEEHKEIGMINIRKYKTSVLAFEVKTKLQKMTLFKISSVDGTQSCVFDSVIACIGRYKEQLTRSNLRQACNCVTGPASFSIMMDLAKYADINILIFINDDNISSGSPFHSIVHNATLQYIILSWNNKKTHTEPYYQQHSNRFSWEYKELVDFEIDKYFNLGTSLSLSKQCIRHCNINNPQFRFMKMRTDGAWKLTAISGYVSDKNRKRAENEQDSGHGKYKIRFLNDCKTIEQDYISSDDETMDWKDIQTDKLRARISSDTAEVLLHTIEVGLSYPDLVTDLVTDIVSLQDEIPMVDNFHALQERLTNLNVDQTATVISALAKPANEKLLNVVNGCQLTRKVIHCLNPFVWLDDEIINSYMHLLLDWDISLKDRDKKRRLSHIFNTFFMNRLLPHGKNYTYKNVKRWAKKINIFELEKVFFPIHINGNHWVLVVAYMQQKRICYRDSNGGDGTIYTSAIKQYLVDELLNKNSDSNITIEQATQQLNAWNVQPNHPTESPKQRNGHDCGMFVCMYVDYMLQDLPEQFSQDDMPMLRRKICYCLLKGKLLYTI